MNKKGFTLIETVIYIGIVSIILVAVANFHFSLGGTASKLSTNIDTSRNSRIALSSIDYLIRNADGLLKNPNGYCSNNKQIFLYFEDDTYLPGNCVGDGGGIDISSYNDRVRISCIPNIDNDYFEACYGTAGNEYYLTSPTVLVSSTDGLLFDITEVEGFPNIETTLKVDSIATDQVYLTSTNTEVSSISLRNEQDNGLIAWWKMNNSSGVYQTLAKDSAGDHNGLCSSQILPGDGLINKSEGSFRFGSSNIDQCIIANSETLNLSESFTLSAWINPNNNSRMHIINKFDSDNYLGYAMYADSGLVYCVLCDGISCNHAQVPIASLLSGDNFVSCVYRRNNDGNNDLNVYSYEEGRIGNGSASIGTTDKILVNADKDLYLANDSIGGIDNFIGYLDEIKIYNRALNSNEIYALMSQGNIPY